jgi:L-threonylcarbamoyladenylate synthase
LTFLPCKPTMKAKKRGAPMKTTILKIDPESVEDEVLETMTEILLNDGIMAYPTETFYGLGAVCLSKTAARKIYLLKEREAGKPLSLIASDMDMVAGVTAELPAVYFSLAEEFWPGPLTLILKAAPTYPPELAGPGPSLAIRIPPVNWIRRLTGGLGVPITATSANISGEKEISKGNEVRKLFKGKVELIVDGGITPGDFPSTIVDLTTEKPRILREGAIPLSSLARFF